MAIAFDSVNGSGAGWAVNNSTYTWQHTCGASATVLVVALWIYDPGTTTVSSVSYNGAALTKVGSITATLEGVHQDTELWYLASPSSGLHNVSVSFTGNAEFSNGYSTSYTGSATAGLVDSFATGQSLTAVSSFAKATTVVASGCWLVGVVFGRANPGNLAAGSGTVIRKTDTSNVGGQSGIADSNGTVSTGSQALNYSWSSAGTVPGAVTMSLSPVGVGSSSHLRASQLVGETLGTGDANLRVTQLVGEALGTGGSGGHLRASQLVGETLGVHGARLRVTQVAGEALCLIASSGLPACPIPMFPDVAGTVGNASIVVGRGWSVRRTPTFASIVQTAFSGRESVVSQQLSGTWQFDLQYDVLHDQTQNQAAYSPYAGDKDLQAITRLFNWARATGGSFYFEDPNDSSRTGQLVAIGDGVTNLFTVPRSVNPNGLTVLTEPVGAVNLNRTVNVYVNGFLQASSAYTITGNQLSFGPAPVGQSITMDFWFYYLCSFVEDQMASEEFLKNLWKLGRCRFRSLLTQC